METRKISRRVKTCGCFRRPLWALVKEEMACVFVSAGGIAMRFSLDCVGVSTRNRGRSKSSQRRRYLVLESSDQSMNRTCFASRVVDYILYAHVSFSFFPLYASETCAPFFFSPALSHGQTHSLPPSLKTSSLPSNAHFLPCQKRSMPLVHRPSKKKQEGISVSLLDTHSVVQIVSLYSQLTSLFLKCRSRIKRDWIDDEQLLMGVAFKEALVLFENRAIYKEKHESQTLPDH